ncbi:MAG: glycoside hydrolase family 3 C-terminal domain-containing protein [Kouleothrix sp.]|nr:glycoside hydrolase family 3 C-terminal domain-containing protein [Kouleothrix sp.]
MDSSKSPDQRATALLAASTLDQELRWLDEQAANNPATTTFSGVTYPVQVPCTPVIQYTDGPQAISGGGTGITAFPSQIGLTATWDPTLSRQKGQAQGYEAFHKHRNVLLGPGVASGRTPQNGRNSEYMGEDPVLAGTLAGAMIRGVQEDNPNEPVEASLKHYVGNEQETSRQTSSSNMDERTLVETYLLPFEIAVKQGQPHSIMCSFNQINGVWACENPTILREYLKTTVGFKGWVVTDFGSQHSTAASLVGGLDQELNRPRFYTPTLLKSALTAGQITQAHIDAAAFRVVRAHIAAGLFDHPLPAAAEANVSTPTNQAVARQVAQAGSVLLKNQGGILPLSGSGKTIAVIGPTASNTATSGISAASVCAYTAPSVPCTPVAPLTGITTRAAQDGNTVVFNNGSDTAAAATTAAGADVAIVFGYYREGEGSDRASLNLDGNGNTLISAVAAANSNTIVVLQTGGPVLMPWIDQVKGVLEVWYAGQEMGNAIPALLWGDVNPSGKLPQTFPKSAADLPAAGSAAQFPGIVDSAGIRQVSYSEGMKVGYRWFDSQNIEPLFPFGYGLSYTTFDYSGLSLHRNTDGTVDVSFTIKNAGSRAGAEVGQVYVDFPSAAGEPSKLLKGYQKVSLQPGQSQQVSLKLDRRAFSYWDTASHSWKIADGVYQIMAGASSRDIRLTDSVWQEFTPPTIDLVAPAEASTQAAGAPGNYPLNSTQNASFTCADTQSGVASCVGTTANGAPFDTSAVGFHSYTVQAADVAGNTASVTHRYNVYWPGWSNFYQPIDNGNVLNVAKAGSGIPIKFSLGGDYGLGIFAAGYPQSMVMKCDSKEPTDVIEETVTAGNSSLTYDPLSGLYTYVWKTDKTWANSCRMLTVKLIDNTVHTAQFQFTK